MRIALACRDLPGLLDDEGQLLREDISARVPSGEERWVATAVLSMLNNPLYVRIDLLPSPSGLLVLEDRGR